MVCDIAVQTICHIYIGGICLFIYCTVIHSFWCDNYFFSTLLVMSWRCMKSQKVNVNTSEQSIFTHFDRSTISRPPLRQCNTVHLFYVKGLASAASGVARTDDAVHLKAKHFSNCCFIRLIKIKMTVCTKHGFFPVVSLWWACDDIWKEYCDETRLIPLLYTWF